MVQAFRYAFILVFSSLVLGGCASNQNLQPGVASLQYSPVESAPGSEKAAKLWQAFERYQGTPYQYGGTTARGFDCSGFITTAYRESLGQKLPRTTSQMLRHGDVVHPDDVKPGDIVFFRIAGKDQHAGIYMGDNRFIHASTSSGVIMSELNGYYWKDRFSGARRFD
ncbi:MAG: C40 family peptidase [Marinobacter sp.]|uniref:C40 family peptidase n=1 Tax=Marinobacter sp. TaxID=50741 RepID=UPI001B66ECF5|nr:NlpC/P60 family protein [Marinobacter sp.]MBQ0746852.1 C40 family peptidase [Marinobacter sp.]MBQ0814308.1 C40 family peptidase [Marinobacter sp.]|tara:strand:+ start:597 stop:1097 length:501 start_codon:yes stop_codon:yes gene_type:complete